MQLRLVAAAPLGLSRMEVELRVVPPPATLVAEARHSDAATPP